jgi:hypothetical protein
MKIATDKKGNLKVVQFYLLGVTGALYLNLSDSRVAERQWLLIMVSPKFGSVV